MSEQKSPSVRNNQNDGYNMNMNLQNPQLTFHAILYHEYKESENVKVILTCLFTCSLVVHYDQQNSFKSQYKSV